MFGVHSLTDFAWLLCMVQATHIFDGLEQWPTHIMFLTRGCLKTFKTAEEIPELADDRLLELVERCAALYVP